MRETRQLAPGVYISAKCKHRREPAAIISCCIGVVVRNYSGLGRYGICIMKKHGQTGVIIVLDRSKVLILLTIS